jgi:hypothetical protein
MSDYVKYQHVEKLGSDEVDGILIGDVYVFPKIDGTNAHAWYEGGKMHYGSRTRELSLEKDNAGFMAAMQEMDGLTELCKTHQCMHVFGEWLVPHSLKTYRADAWRQFYVFDIALVLEGKVRHMGYDWLSNECEKFGVNYIAPLRIIHNPTVENLTRLLPENNFLIEDGKGAGEGIVMKNYDFVNRFGRQTWAKIVTSEFKEKHHKAMGAPTFRGTKMVEEEIVVEYVTTALIEKVYAKICVEHDGWNSRRIPQLLSTVLYDLVNEHAWDICKKYKMPKVDFKNLNRFCVMKIKSVKPELF